MYSRPKRLVRTLEGVNNLHSFFSDSLLIIIFSLLFDAQKPLSEMVISLSKEDR